MGNLLFLGYALGYAALIIAYWRYMHRINRKMEPVDYGLLILSTALIYENMILAIGGYIGASDTLEILNRFRFVFHAALAPFLGVLGISVACRAGVSFINKHVIYGAFGIASILAIYGIWTYLQLPLHAIDSGGILRYTTVERSYLALIMVLSSTFLCIILGAIIWWKHRVWYLFAGAIAVILGNAGPRAVTVFTGNFAELLLVAGLMITLIRLNKKGR